MSDISRATLDQAEAVIDSLQDEKVLTLCKKHFPVDCSSKKDLKDNLYEDYAYVIPLLRDLGGSPSAFGLV